MFKRAIAVITSCIFILTACNNDDEQRAENPETNNPPPTRIEKSSFTLNGVSQPESQNISVAYSESPQGLEIVTTFQENILSEFAMSPIRDEGSYTSNQAIGFAVVIGAQAWFCNTGCTVVIEEHDSEGRWIDISISGQLQDLLGTSTATLNNARISKFY